MADMHSPEKRRQIMSNIRSKNSEAELIAFRYLRNQGVYFQKHYKRVVGTPDIALPRRKKAVFIDSAFWHGKDYDLLKQAGKLSDFWATKISKNIQRDLETRARLVSQGWQIKVVWETDVKRKRTRETTLADIKQFLTA